MAEGGVNRSHNNIFKRTSSNEPTVRLQIDIIPLPRYVLLFSDSKRVAFFVGERESGRSMERAKKRDSAEIVTHTAERTERGRESKREGKGAENNALGVAERTMARSNPPKCPHGDTIAKPTNFRSETDRTKCDRPERVFISARERTRTLNGETIESYRNGEILRKS